MAAYQPFLKHIYWNFMESSNSGIRIWLDLWVSASNELGKRYFWQNLLEIRLYAGAENIALAGMCVDTNGHNF